MKQKLVKKQIIQLKKNGAAGQCLSFYINIAANIDYSMESDCQWICFLQWKIYSKSQLLPHRGILQKVSSDHLNYNKAVKLIYFI